MRLGKPNRSKEALLSFDRMREYLLYPPVTGLWVWNERPHKRQGTPAGSVATDEDGRQYIRICIDGMRFMAHRMAWFYMTGAWPEEEVDHWNRNGLDNRWVNLRLAERSAGDNQHNRKLNSNNKTGVKGVTIRPDTGKYRVTIGVGGSKIRLGQFDSLADAKAAREAYARAAHGEFYRES